MNRTETQAHTIWYTAGGMNGICFDTSGTTGSVALIMDDVIAGHMVLSKVYGHNETLLPAIRLLMEQAGLSMDDVHVVGFVRGPGTFTGIRIGTAVAYGLAAAHPDIRLVGHTSLYLLARSVRNHPDETIMPILDARKRQVYTAVYRNDTAITPLTVLSPAALPDFLRSHQVDPLQVVLTGPGCTAYAAPFQTIFPGIPVRPHPAGLAETLAHTILHPGGETPVTEPLYIRKSDAELHKNPTS